MEGSDMNQSVVLVQRSIVGTQLHPGCGSDTEREENMKHNSQTGTVFLLLPPHSPLLPLSVTAALCFLHSSHTNLHPSFICVLQKHTNIVSNEKWVCVAKMVQTPLCLCVCCRWVFVCSTTLIIASLKVSAALQSTTFNELPTTFRKT